MAHKVKAGSFADKARGSRQARGYGAAWDKLRERIKRRASGLCEPCLKIGLVHEGHDCDHIVSKEEWRRLHGSLAGVDDESNLQWIARDCHRIKTLAEAAAARGAHADCPAHLTAAGQAAARAGGGEKSEAPSLGTDLLAKLSRAGNLGGGVPPAADGGLV